jgi:replicative DNA helicase
MSDISIENLILSNLLYDENYIRSVLPFLKEEYFVNHEQRITYSLIDKYFTKYNSCPSREALKIELDELALNTDTHASAVQLVTSLSKTDTDEEWLMKQTEKYCQDKAIYNAIMESIQVIDGKSDKDKGALPEILADALAVSFDNHIGHDFLEDFESRYDFYHKKVERQPFDLDYFNRITRGGIPRKTLNVILAGTGVGKTLMMCHFAAANLMQGKNVLYVTLEMAEERIAERIDANLMGVPLNDLATYPKETYETKLNRVKGKTAGKLIIKEYPTASIGSGHLRHLLNELKLKKNFIPDIIYIDYLNLCVSSRIRMGANVNTYSYVKAIAEELRGLAVEFNLPIFTATQTNRTGFTSSDVGLEDTSESFGLPATADFMFAAISNEELESLGQLLIKQLKNRYNDPGLHRRFVLGIDRSRMKLYDVEQNAQQNIGPDIADKPVMDNTEFGEGLKRERFDKTVFDSWK